MILCLPKEQSRFHLALHGENKQPLLEELWVRTSLILSAFSFKGGLGTKSNKCKLICLVFNNYNRLWLPCIQRRSQPNNLQSYQHHTYIQGVSEKTFLSDHAHQPSLTQPLPSYYCARSGILYHPLPCLCHRLLLSNPSRPTACHHRVRSRTRL